MFRRRVFRIILTVLGCFLSVAIFGAITENQVMNNAFGFVLAPLQEFSSLILSNIKDSLPASKTEEEYKKIVEAKEEELRKARACLIEYENVKKENEQYKKVRDLKGIEELKFELASVISRDPDENFYGFSINRGSVHGISNNDPVITASGLVGWVETVRPTSSYVKTILSADSRIGAVFKEKSESGIITGSLRLADKNITRMVFLRPKSELKKEDMIVTSGLCGMFPRDLPVGKVREIKADENDGSPYAEIEPYENIHEVSDVFVVTSFLGKGEITY